MAYSDFTLRQLKKQFALEIDEQLDLFATVRPVPLSDLLTTTLKENVPLAIAVNTEKARSELIITPMLLEVRRESPIAISFFSGTEFNVDSEQNLTGYCDYILSRSREQLSINAPIATIVEAKNENIKAGLGQCVAEMYAAQLFNRREENQIETIYGAVTTGEIWKFLKLRGSVASIDLNDYYIRDRDRILGILMQMTSLD